MSEDLWVDEAILTINKAVVHSYRTISISIVSHHMLMKEFVPWYKQELKTRGYCPGNWKWIVPPLAPTTSDAYLGLSKMTEYTLRPAILPPRPKGWRHFSDAMSNPQTKDGPTLPPPPKMNNWSKLRIKSRFISMNMTTLSSLRPQLLIVYASVSGTAEKGAVRLGAYFSVAFIITFINLRDWNAGIHAKWFAKSAAVIFVTSTYGSGIPPPNAGAFISWTVSDDAACVMDGLPFAVLGYGSKLYPRFAAAADKFTDCVGLAGGVKLIVGKIDQISGSEKSFIEFLRGFSDVISLAAAENRNEAAGQRTFVHRLSSKLTDLSALASSKLCEHVRQVPFSYVKLHGLPSNERSDSWDDAVNVRVIKKTELLPTASNFYGTAYISLDTSGVPGGLNYSAGDNIVVYPIQMEEAVARAADAFGWTGRLNEDFMLIAPRGDCNGVQGVHDDRPLPFRTPTSVKNMLHVFLKLEAKPQFDDLFHLARHASSDDAVKIALLLEDKSGAMVEKFLDGCDWPGLFERLPSLVSCPIEELLMLVSCVFFTEPHIWQGVLT